MNFSAITTSTAEGLPLQPSARSNFAATRWTLVARSRGETPEARAALSELCDRYYEPVLAFLRRERRREDEARELAQEFFARILSGSGFSGADQTRGRFRSYLLGALKHFLVESRLKAQREKRGGGVAAESIDALEEMAGSEPIQIGAEQNELTEAAFDRDWALAIMQRSLAAVEQEMSARGKQVQFAVLKSWLVGDGIGVSQAEAARRLRLSEGAVKVAVHRLRKRFAELVRAEILHTLRDPGQADEELSHLIAVLSSTSAQAQA